MTGTMMKISDLNLDYKYQFFPDLPKDEFQALKDDIEEWGIQTPPEIDEDLRPLDGWNRIRACEELGIEEIPVVIRDAGMSEEMKVEHAIILNMDRRQITGTQREDVICKVIDLFPDYSFTRLAKITGLSDKTIRKIVNRNRPKSSASEVGRTTGLDGRNRPDSKISSENQRASIREALSENPDKSDRQIARELGTSPTTVGTQRKAMEKEKEEGIETDEPPWDEDSDEEYVPEPVKKETKADSLKRALCDEADRLDGVLNDLFADYRHEYAEEARLGLLKLSEVIAKYEEIVD